MLQLDWLFLTLNQEKCQSFSTEAFVIKLIVQAK